jgi:uncharacterized protein
MKVAYIDIETNYVGPFTDPRLFSDFQNHKLTVVGVRVLDDRQDDFFQFFDQDCTKAALLKTLAGVQKLVSYNGRSVPDSIKRRIGFDFPVINAQLGILLDREFQHTDVVPECWKKNLFGGLKKVEETLGLKRKLPGKDGAWASEAYRQFKSTGDKKYLDELLAYNREDVFMLREVETLLAKR